jgi:transcriptional regulator with XRE-family HTH domain
MKGSELKEILRREGVVFNQLAESLEMSQQNLSAAFTRDDVKSGLLEKIAKTLNKPIGYFYGESLGPIQTVVGDNNTQVGGDYQISDSGVLELLRIKDEQLLLTIKQVSKAQEQMDRVLDRFGGATSSEDPEGM